MLFFIKQIKKQSYSVQFSVKDEPGSIANALKVFKVSIIILCQ